MTKKTIVFTLLLILLAAIFFIKPYFDFTAKTLKISLIKTLLSQDSLKTYDGKVGILILGIAGSNHAGPNLSDSIIVLNYDLKSNKILTITIPRDIWSDTLKDKINSAYAYGENKMEGGGMKLAKAEIESIVGLPLQYAAVIDFDKFVEFIDFLGGVEIDVARSFVDHDFPIPGREDDLCSGDAQYRCRYETVKFSKGAQRMDGKTALKFVRSRHAVGPEGGDFARSKRQQKTIAAIKTKISKIFLTKRDTKDWEKLYKIMDRLFKRDISNQQAAILVKSMILNRQLKQQDIELVEDFFAVPDRSLYEGRFVFVPKGGNFESIKNYIKCIVSSAKNCERYKKV